MCCPFVWFVTAKVYANAATVRRKERIVQIVYVKKSLEGLWLEFCGAVSDWLVLSRNWNYSLFSLACAGAIKSKIPQNLSKPVRFPQLRCSCALHSRGDPLALRSDTRHRNHHRRDIDLRRIDVNNQPCY
jgi:hypothetical protein